jgi:hypothetical protein
MCHSGRKNKNGHPEKSQKQKTQKWENSKMG